MIQRPKVVRIRWAGRFSVAESLKLPRTGPPGWKIYTARGSKFGLYLTNFAWPYFDLRFWSGYSFPWTAASSADSAPVKSRTRASGDRALMRPPTESAPCRAPGRRRSCGSVRRIAIIGTAENEPDRDPKE